MTKRVVSAYVQGSQVFHLLAHPARVQILDELRRGEACVCHLQAVLKRPQAYVSQQLKLLRDAGVLETYKDGLNVYYRIVDAQILRLLEETLGPAQPARPLHDCPCPKCATGTCAGEDRSCDDIAQ